MPSPEQVLTAAQMRSAEQALVDSGRSVGELMRRAGAGAAEWIWRIAMGRPVTVLCGPGNNGGDGYVIAEVLERRGLAVTVVAPLPPTTVAARAAAGRWGGTPVADSAGVRGAVLVDCLFGTGLSRPLGGDLARLLSGLAQRYELLVAVDLPAGVSTDDGASLGAMGPYHLTLALGAWKPAHFLLPSVALMGERRLIDLGIGVVHGAGTAFPRPRLAAPAADAHKYSRGLVGIVGGEMPGAALLAASAAQRGGAGYVKLMSAAVHAAAPLSLVIDRHPLAEALADRRWSALVVGPGLGRGDDARTRLAAVLERGVPTVIDADALHLLDDDALEGIDTSRLLVTPHAGELAAMCRTFAVASGSKVAQARHLAEVTGLTVLAKGADTILAAADGRLAYFSPAPAWLSVAGTGDVLAGLAGARMATGSDPWSAAGEAVWLHGEAARVAGPALSADDLIPALSKAYRQFL